MSEEVKEVLDLLKELLDDSTVPRNVKNRIEETIDILTADEDISLKVSKALSELEEISNDSNMQPFTRTQLWNIISVLETLC